MVRVIAFQAQSRLAAEDAVLAAQRFGRYLRDLAVDVALICETGLRDGSDTLEVFSATMLAEYKYLVLNHYPPGLPKGKGVMIVTKHEYPPRAKSVVRDRHARAMAATIRFRVDAHGDEHHRSELAVRLVSGYGVTGMTSGAEMNDVDREVADFIAKQVGAAADEDAPALVGVDANSVADEGLDCINTVARANPHNFISSILASGCQCTFRLHFPGWQVGSRLTPRGANFLTRVLIRQTPLLRCAAAAIHWSHGMETDHAPFIADVVGACAASLPTVDTALTGLGVGTNVPWRRFLRLTKEAKKAVERAEALSGDAPVTVPEQAFLDSISEFARQHKDAWVAIAQRARAVPDVPSNSDRARAELGVIAKQLVCTVNRTVCALVRGRKKNGFSIWKGSSKLARKWSYTRAALHSALSSLPPSGTDWQAAEGAAVSAAKSWRETTAVHKEAFPDADLGALAKERIPSLLSGRGSGRAAWVRKVRRTIAEDKRNAWAVVARRLHRQALSAQERNLLLERREAHRKGDTAAWLSLYVGAASASYPAAMEAPTATTVEGKLAAGAMLLQGKYGSDPWDLNTSGLFRSHRDDAGRVRGGLLPDSEVSDELQAASRAARLSTPALSFGDLARPLDQKERNRLWNLFEGSSPGISQFKLQVAECLGAEAQEAVIAIVEAIIRTGVAPAWLKRALVTWLEKPNGGHRGVSLLEELLKAPDAIMTQRVEEVLRQQPLGSVLSASNVGYQRHRSATLVLDLAMDLWDAARGDPQRQFTHFPWDYIAYFDVMRLPIADAVMAQRGVPDKGRRLFVELHSCGVTLCAFTPWGLTLPIPRKVGAHQGSVSAPLLSRFVGEIPCRLVDGHPSPAQFCGVPVAQHSLVDDGNGFAEGPTGGQDIADALSAGCVSCGLGIDCKQGAAYSTGPAGTLRVRHVLPSGQVASESIRVDQLTSPMKLLGVVSTWKVGPAESVARLDKEIIRQLGLAQSRKSDVFELQSAMSMFVLSHLVFAPNCHRVPYEVANQWDERVSTVVKRCLRVHPTTTPELIYASSDFGGLGFQSCSGCVMANRARELLVSFHGDELQARVRRGRWEELTSLGPRDIQSCSSTLKEAVEFLAKKGFYLRDAKELFLSRVLAQLASHSPGWGQIERQIDRKCDTARLAYSSVGALAASLRAGFSSDPTTAQASSEAWWCARVGIDWRRLPCGPAQIASAIARATEEARDDWYGERRIFGSSRSTPSGNLELQWWRQENWQGDAEHFCPRTAALADVGRHPASCIWGATDGGANDDAAAASNVFADLELPADLGSPIARPVTWLRHTARLPEFVGSRRCGVHEAELAALIACAARAPLSPIQLSVDRDALISLVDALPGRSSREDVRGNFPAWELRLQALLRDRERAIGSSAQTAPIPGGFEEWRASSAFPCTQLIWTPSHQPVGDHPRVPCELCASLNHWADLGAEEALARGRPANIAKPAGGTRFFLEHLGRTVVGDPADYIRGGYTAAANVQLGSLSTQGFAAAEAGRIWGAELAEWRAVRVPESLAHLAAELSSAWTPGTPIDMHAWVFRIRHGLGGSYVSLARRSERYRKIADAISDDGDLSGHSCLLCGEAVGTRWHAFWSCKLAEPGMPECDETVRSALYQYAEDALRSMGFPWGSEPPEGHGRPLLEPAHAARYPLLSRAGWLLPTLTADGQPAGDLDLATRAAMPKELAQALARQNKVVPRASREPVPWVQRTEQKRAASIRAIVTERGWAPVKELLTGVVLHLAVLRKRYLTALAIWAERWEERRGTRALGALGRKLNTPIRCTRPCRGSACVAERAAGQPGRSAVGTMVKCSVCRFEQRCRESAAYLEDRLAHIGSRMRTELLYEVVKIERIQEILAAQPGRQGGAIPVRLARSAAALSGVPYREDSGAIVAPEAAWRCRAAQGQPPASQGTACQSCAAKAQVSSCLGCGRSWCNPGPQGCSALPPIYWLAHGQDLGILLCPDCARHSARGGAAAGAGAAAASPAATVMASYAAAPVAYPAASAALAM